MNTNQINTNQAKQSDAKPTLALYCVTEKNRYRLGNPEVQLVIAEGFDDAARRYVLHKRYLSNDLEILAEAQDSMLFVAPAGLPLDETGVVLWDAGLSEMVMFDRDWLNT